MDRFKKEIQKVSPQTGWKFPILYIMKVGIQMLLNKERNAR